MGFIKSKNVEKPVFFHFLRRKTPFNVFCVAFRQISRLVRSLARARIINIIANKVACALFLPEICKPRNKELYFIKIDFKRIS